MENKKVFTQKKISKFEPFPEQMEVINNPEPIPIIFGNTYATETQIRYSLQTQEMFSKYKKTVINNLKNSILIVSKEDFEFYKLIGIEFDEEEIQTDFGLIKAIRIKDEGDKNE